MEKKLIFHPYLFVIYGVSVMITSNMTELTMNSLRVLGYSTIACTILLAFLYIVLKDKVKASLISSVATLLIFTFGHVRVIIQANFSPSSDFFYG